MPHVRKLPRFSRPGSCLYFPGRMSDERGFFLFDNVLDGPNGDMHVGVSGEGLRTIAERHPQFGLVHAEKLEAAEARARAMEVELEDAQARIEELEEFKSKITGLAADGFEIKRRVGRPPAKKED